LIISYTLVSLINAPRAMLADKRKADSRLAGVADVPETGRRTGCFDGSVFPVA
jgi:hypothetical protein